MKCSLREREIALRAVKYCFALMLRIIAKQCEMFTFGEREDSEYVEVSSMIKLMFLAYLLLILIDWLVIYALRCLLLDFLIGRRNLKSAKRIHAEQPFIQRVSMGYIKGMLKNYIHDFVAYRTLYLIILYTLIPQYIAIIVCNICLGYKSLYVIGVFAAIKLFIDIFLRFQVDGLMMSKYRKK